MATKYWEGDISGDITDADNWDADTLPSNDDTIIFSDNTATFTDLEGDLSGITGLAMIVGNLWDGNFGDETVACTFDLASLEYSGQGREVYIDCDTTDLPITVADTGGGDNALSIGGTADITTLRVIDGKGTISNRTSRTITTIEVIGASNVTLDLATVPSTGTTLRMDSGTVKIADSHTNIFVSGGLLEITGEPTAISTVDIYDGKVNFNVSGTSAAITTSLSIYDGEFSATDITASVATITGTELYENGKLDEQNGLESITWSGGIAYYGGTLALDAGRVLTIS